MNIGKIGIGLNIFGAQKQGRGKGAEKSSIDAKNGETTDLDVRWEALLKESKSDGFGAKFPITRQGITVLDENSPFDWIKDVFSKKYFEKSEGHMPKNDDELREYILKTYEEEKQWISKTVEWENLLRESKTENFKLRYPSTSRKLYCFDRGLSIGVNLGCFRSEHEERAYILEMYEKEKKELQENVDQWNEYKPGGRVFNKKKWDRLSEIHNPFLMRLIYNIKVTESEKKCEITFNYISILQQSIELFKKYGYPRRNTKSLVLEMFEYEKQLIDGKISSEQFEVIKKKIHCALLKDCADTALNAFKKIDSYKSPKISADGAEAAMDVLEILENPLFYPMTNRFLEKKGIVGNKALDLKILTMLSSFEFQKMTELIYLDRKIELFNLVYDETIKVKNLYEVYKKHLDKQADFYKDLYGISYEELVEKIDKQINDLRILSKKIYTELFNTGIFPECKPDVAGLLCGKIIYPNELEERIKELNALPLSLIKDLRAKNSQIVFYNRDRGIDHSFKVKRFAGTANKQRFEARVSCDDFRGTGHVNLHETAHLVFYVLEENPEFKKTIENFMKLCEERLENDLKIRDAKEFEKLKETKGDDFDFSEFIEYVEEDDEIADISIETEEKITSYTYYFKGTIDGKPVTQIILNGDVTGQESELFAEVFAFYYMEKSGGKSPVNLRECDPELFAFFEKFDADYRATDAKPGAKTLLAPEQPQAESALKQGTVIKKAVPKKKTRAGTRKKLNTGKKKVVIQESALEKQAKKLNGAVKPRIKEIKSSGGFKGLEKPSRFRIEGGKGRFWLKPGLKRMKTRMFLIP